MGYIGKLNVDGSTHLVGSTLYGTCATAAATAAKVVTCADFNELVTGVTIHVKFTYANSVANPTLNVNSTGAKDIMRYGTTKPSASAATSWQAGSVVSFTYDGTYWQMNGWLNDNTTYTNASLGQGYGVSTTSGSSTFAVTLASYTLLVGGIVSVKFSNNVPANANMNINSKGVKSIYYKGSAITANIILAGDTATFIYDGTSYHLLAIDKAIERGSGENSHAESLATASGETSHGEGTSSATASYAHAEGKSSTASSYASHAEGWITTASGQSSHAEGWSTTASGNYSHAEGTGTTASAYATHTEGMDTTASGNYSHSEGYYCDAGDSIQGLLGKSAHAEGYYTHAIGNASHAEGFHTTANNDFQHVFGKYNDYEDYPELEGDISVGDGIGTYVEIVGNGEYGNPSNARTLDWNGNEVLAGKLTVGADPTNAMDVVTKQYVDVKEITDVDANTLTTQGTYYFTVSDSTNYNLPRVNGWLWVLPGHNWVKQIMMPAGTVNSSDNVIYMRMYQGSTRGSWYKFTGNLGQTSTKTHLSINGLSITFQKVGDLFVQVAINSSITSLPTGSTSVGTLPTDYKPNYVPYNVMLENSRSASNGSGGVIQLTVAATGAVSLYNYGAAISSSTWLRHNGMYPLAS